MTSQVAKVVVLGAGSAGYLSAVSLKRLVPKLEVVVVHSPSIPVIGVGESTTAFVPVFLHTRLGLDRKRFFSDVKPIWKLGVKFIWGDPRDSHFNYSLDSMMTLATPELQKLHAFYCIEDWTDAGRYSGLMDRGLSPCVRGIDGSVQVHHEGCGYHFENTAFLAYLKTAALELGVQFISGDVVGVTKHESGDIRSLTLGDGRDVSGDMFVDCSGFQSFLLGQAMGERYESYQDVLYCDTAVVGSWQRDGIVNPYTTAETMDHGWCWQIDFTDHVTRGYVFSSQFCDTDQAMREMKDKNPLLNDNLRVVTFPSGRYENFWSGNVVAVGNASGFVEPLEATAIHMICVQIQFMCTMLQDSNRRIVSESRRIFNRKYRDLWDEIRDFLAVHYKFNRKSDTPFWRFCREQTSLGGVQPVVELYQKEGPVRIIESYIPHSTFAFEGYLIMMICQRIRTNYENEFTAADRRAWDEYRNQVRREISPAVNVRDGLQLVNSPHFQWPPEFE